MKAGDGTESNDQDDDDMALNIKEQLSAHCSGVFHKAEHAGAK
jgi:hypothetical protein